MITTLKNWLKFLSLSNCNDWEQYSKRGWNRDVDRWIRKTKFYRHKKYPYFITNAYMNNPLHITDLVNRFLKDYKKDNLLMGETYYTVSD